MFIDYENEYETAEEEAYAKRERRFKKSRNMTKVKKAKHKHKYEYCHLRVNKTEIIPATYCSICGKIKDVRWDSRMVESHEPLFETNSDFTYIKDFEQKAV